MGGGYFIFCCNMKVVCVLLLVAFCAVHAKRDAYLDILADEFEKMGMMDEDGGWDELEKPVPNAKPEEPEPAVGPGKPELPTVKPEKPEPPTVKPEKPEPPTAEPEKPEPPTAEPEKPKPTEEIDEAHEEAGDHFLSGILLPIKGKRSCHHRG